MVESESWICAQAPWQLTSLVWRHNGIETAQLMLPTKVWHSSLKPSVTHTHTHQPHHMLKAAKEHCFISVSTTISFPCKWMSASAPPLSIPLKLAGVARSPGGWSTCVFVIQGTAAWISKPPPGDSTLLASPPHACLLRPIMDPLHLLCLLFHERQPQAFDSNLISSSNQQVQNTM